MAQVGVVEAILHLSIVLFEVPTGIVADLYGRKISLIIGHIISLFYAVIMMLSGHFFFFTLAFAILGLSTTFKSGADQALLYDTLKLTNNEADYTRIFGNQTAFILISMSLAQVLGGWMAKHSWHLVYFSLLIVQVVALIPMLFLREPPRSDHELTQNKRFFSHWKQQGKDSLIIWKKCPEIRKPIFFYIAIMTSIIVIIFYSQEYFSRLGFSKSQIGIIFMIESLLGVFSSKIAHHIEKKWTFSLSFMGAYQVFVLMLFVFITVKGLLAVFALFLLGMLSTFVDPIFTNFIQIKLDSNVRATFFSMISVLISLSVMIIFPLFGRVIDVIGFQNAFFCLGGFLMLPFFFSMKINKWFNFIMSRVSMFSRQIK